MPLHMMWIEQSRDVRLPGFNAHVGRRVGNVGVEIIFVPKIRKVMAERFVETPVEDLPAEAMSEFERLFVAAGKPIGRTRYEAKP